MRVSSVSLASLASTVAYATSTGPFLKAIGDNSWVIGNDHWNVTQGPVYATQLFWDGVPGDDLVGSASGHYIGYGKFGS